MKKQKIASIAFWSLLGINLFYLNGLFASFTKIPAFFSPIILLCCFIVILSVPKPGYYSFLFKVLILFYISYMFIGSLSLLAYPENIHYKTSILKQYRTFISSVIIYWTIYQYMINEYYLKGKERLYEILHTSSLMLLLPLFFTIFGSEIGLSETLTYAKDFGERQIGIFTNPNTTGLHANYMLCFALYSIITNRKWKLFWLVIAVASCYAAFLSMSRAAMLMAVLNTLFFIIFIIYNFFKFSTTYKVISILTVSFLLFTSVYIYNNFKDISKGMSYAQISRIIDSIEIGRGELNDKTTSERTGLAKLVIPKIFEHPFIGNGFGSMYRIKESGLGVHNTALLLMGETGFFAIFIFIIFSAIYVGWSLSVRIPAIKFLFLSIFFTYINISFLTSHNGLEERLSNVILAILISLLSIIKFPVIKENAVAIVQT